MRGYGQVFSFPFRIYASEDLPRLEGETSDGKYRVRVYTPILVRQEGDSLSPPVPFDKWPEFSWSPQSSPDDRLLPPTNVHTRASIWSRAFDTIRIDIWGDSSRDYARTFLGVMLSWLRHLSGQDWIGEFEPHTDSDVKAAFEIDRDGLALSSPWVLVKGFTPAEYMGPVDPKIWSASFAHTLEGSSPPIYWSFFQDGNIYRILRKPRECILAFALSLEVARDTVFPRFAKTKVRPGVGAVLTKPFDSTDLLAHLSKALASVRNRDLREEHPGLFRDLQRLYVARHHVAHGRNPIITSERGGHRPVEDSDLKRWSDTVYGVLRWIETL